MTRRIFCFLLALALILPEAVPAQAADRDSPTARAARRVKQVIAHRGSSIDRPENTLAAVRRAIEAGAQVTETDVRTTRDGVLVCRHDDDLARTTNGKGRVGEKTLAELKQLDAGSWFNAKFKNERIPTLREILEACKGKIAVMLDLKETGEPYARQVAAEVRQHGDPRTAVLGVRSVEQAKLFRKLLPGSRQMGLVPTIESIEDFARAGVPMIRLWPRWLVDRTLVPRVRKLGRTLHLGAGTGKRDEVLPLLAWEPESLSSEDPARLLRTLSEIAGVSKPRPNVVIVLADDLGYGDLGCFGNRVIRTPNLDRFAREGLKLTDCYAAAANCSPSRAGLMTGRTPTRLGIHNWIPMLSPMHLRKEELTIATLLHRAGYATAHTGKWHLNGMFNLPGQPQPKDHGFDHWFSTQNNALPNHHNPYNFVRNSIPVGELKGYSGELVADEAIRWLTTGRDRSKPFFLFVCFHEPHEPIATDPRFSGLYPFKDDPSRSDHHGNVTQMDDAFGRLMRALDAQKLRDDTLVFVTSDNGPAITNIHPHGSVGPLRAKKGHLYEGGIRVPGMVRWPGRIKAGSVSHEPVCGVDLLPTVCAVAGAAVPADRAIDGASLLPLFEGKPVERKVPLYWHFNGALSKPKVAMRIGDWKLLGHLDSPEPPRGADILEEQQKALKKAELTSFELYNLRTDIGEKNDLGGKEPERLKRMAAEMRKMYREVRDESPTWPAWKWPRYEAGRIEWPPYWKKRPGK
jgi:arylsulfatase